MKRSIAVIAGLWIGLACMYSVSEGQSPNPPAIKKEVSIPGNTAWTNTSIRLKPGDRVTITATGTVCFDSESPDSCVGPQGWPRNTYKTAFPANWNICDDPFGSFNHAALVGEVGSSKFLVGNSTNFSGKDGFLYLGINDCSLRGAHGNTGEFKALIKVYR